MACQEPRDGDGRMHVAIKGMGPGDAFVCQVLQKLC